MENRNSMKIFLVDDDAFCLALYEQHLRNIGFSGIFTFENGTQCIEQLHENPDVILLDHNMDIMDGVEVLRKIKRVNPDIQVVFISGQNDVAVAVNSLKYGAFDYIVKGNDDLKRLEVVLQKVMEVNALLQQKSKGIIKRFFSAI